MMTPREFMHLKFVWALEQARFHNAHINQDGLAFVADDFLWPDSREERRARRLIEKHELLMEQRKLNAMQAGTKAGVPKWAIEAVN